MCVRVTNLAVEKTVFRNLRVCVCVTLGVQQEMRVCRVFIYSLSCSVIQGYSK